MTEEEKKARHRESQARYREKNREKQKEASRKWRANNPDKVRAARDAWAKENGEKLREIKKAWNDKNKEKARTRSVRWYAENKEKRVAYLLANYERNKKNVRASSVNRRARIKESPGRLSNDVAQRLLILQRGKCACCGKPLGAKYHMDHIMPIALGGENIDKNIQLLHQRCNIQKHAKHPVDFMRTRGYLL